MIFKNQCANELEMDYNEYSMSKIEKITIIIISAIILFAVGYIFYQSRFKVLGVISLGALFVPKHIEKMKIKKQKSEIINQFKDSLYSLSSSLEVGKSANNAIKDVIRDLLIQYQEKDRIVIEYKLILKKIEYNRNISEAFADFAIRSGSEDIANFASIFEVANEVGGNLNKIIKRTSRLIAEKTETKKEISLLVEAKKNEIKLLNLMPVLIVYILSITVKEFMQPVYDTLLGFVGTTVAITLIIIAGYISNKILDIEV